MSPARRYAPTGWPASIGTGGRLRRNPHRDLVKDTVIWEVERGLKLSGEDVARGHALRSRAWDWMRVFQEKYEYFILPSTQVPPFDLNQPYVR